MAYLCDVLGIGFYDENFCVYPTAAAMSCVWRIGVYDEDYRYITL